MATLGGSVAVDRIKGPGNENHHHDGGDLHDAERLSAGKRNANAVGVPKVECHQNGETRGK